FTACPDADLTAARRACSVSGLCARAHVLVFGAVGIAVVRFRRREGLEPSRRDSAPVAECVYLAILAVVALGLIAATFRTEGGEDGPGLASRSPSPPTSGRGAS